jgi:hypothetical protein
MDGGSPSKDEDVAVPTMHTRTTRIWSRLRGAKPVPSRTYEITFAGQAGTVLQAEFDDCEISVGPSTTTLHLQLADQGALHGLLQRIASFGLELIDVSVVPPADVRDETSDGRQLNSGQQNE